jgi:hypothetical protein
MAYTKSNELQTRIALKYDSYENWTSNNPVLLAGEVAIATIPTPAEGQPNATGFQNLPNVVMKVGDGTSHYNDLKFVSALAADVYDWAKAATRPTYQAEDIVGLQKFVEDHSDFDTNTEYTIVPVEGAEYKYELKYKNLEDSAFKSFNTPVYMDMSGADTRLKAVEETIKNLTGASGGIQGAINEAIAKLDGTASQAAGADGLALSVTTTDGVVTAISGSIKANTYDAYGAAAAVQGETSSTVKDAMDAAKAADDKAVAAQKAADNEAAARKAAIEGLDFEGVEGTQEGTTIKFVDKISQADGVISAELGELVFNSAYNASTNKAATMSDVTAAVADLNGAMHFEGVSTTDPVSVGVSIAEKPDYVAAAGDVVIFMNEGTPVEYVYDGAKWHQLGNESIAQKAIEALDVEDIAVGADSTLSVIGETDGAIHATPVKIQIAKSQVTDLEKDLKALADEDARLEGLIGDNAAAIAVINDKDTGKSMREVAASEATKAVQSLNKENAAQEGKYISAVSQANGIVTATYADLPTIPALELVEGTATTPEAESVAVVADIDVDGHKITDTRVNVATAAGVAAAIARLDANKDVSTAKHVMSGITQVDGVITSIDEVQLADIAFSGDVKDLKQEANSYVVFNCGSSSVNI